MERWAGKVAVVTGCSTGIGSNIAIDLVKRGMNVVAVARREEKVAELQNQLCDAPGKLYPKKTDVSNEDDVKQLFLYVKNQFGTVHVLINNAGITRYGRLYDQNPKYWRQVLDTNVMGLSICTQEALKLMKETGVNDGHIIHINSIVGHGVPQMSNPITGMYAASKHAVTALTETLRQELRFLGSKIKISSVSPGIVRTPIGDHSNAALEEHERVSRFSMTTPTEEPPMLDPQDISDSVIYVLSTPPHVQVHELIIKPVGELI